MGSSYPEQFSYYYYMKSMTKIIYNYLCPDWYGGESERTGTKERTGKNFRVQFWVLRFLFWMLGQWLGLGVQGADAVVSK